MTDITDIVPLVRNASIRGQPRAGTARRTLNVDADGDRSSRVNGLPVRRELGVYYTPEAIAQALVRWALAGRPGRVLDPSYGGGSFLRAAMTELRHLGVPDPGQLVYGVDLDPRAHESVAGVEPLGVQLDHLHARDFFTVEPRELGPFQAVVGNPPYIRHHWMDRAIQTRAAAACARAGVQLTLRASAWAYFVVHSMQFVAAGGRLVFILPGALLHADYAAPVLAALRHNFDLVHVIRLAQRLFAGTDEETIIVLASGKRDTPEGRLYVQEARLFADVEGLLQRSEPAQSFVHPEDRLNLLLPSSTLELWRQLLAQPQVQTLGTLASISIGVVTGANEFFVRKPAEVGRFRCNGVDFRPIVARSIWLKTLHWRQEDQASRQAEEASQLMIIDEHADLGGSIAELIETGVNERIHQRLKCRNRKPWYSLRDTAEPDAFLPYMSSTTPRLVLNGAGATCTNAIHRVRWISVEDPRRAIAGSWTSIFALSAEIEGRYYGGGVLKLEPGSATHLAVPAVPGAEEHFDEVDTCSRKLGVTAAAAIADERIMRKALGLSRADVRLLQRTVQQLRERRLPRERHPRNS